MADGPDNLRKGRSEKPAVLVESLANEALRTLAQKPRGAGLFALSESLLHELYAAILDGDESDRWAVIDKMTASGISDEELIDVYIPTVARRLGAFWCEDSLGFAEVTVGSARLQGLLHEISQRSRVTMAGVAEYGIAVVVIADEYHTLGALVLTSQLRRLGYSVKLKLGAADRREARALADGNFDAVLISASHSETLADLEKFVKTLKKELHPGTPIIIGGPILDNCEDVAAATGAHFATSDVIEALRVCQLKTSRTVLGKQRLVD